MVLLSDIYTDPYFSFPNGQKKSNKRKGLLNPAIIPLPELLRKPAACATQAIRGTNGEVLQFLQSPPNSWVAWCHQDSIRMDGLQASLNSMAIGLYAT